MPDLVRNLVESQSILRKFPMLNNSKSYNELFQEIEQLKLENESLKASNKLLLQRKQQQSDTTNLRHEAEKLHRAKSFDSGSDLSDIETVRLIHELQVHQIELELQNEELTLAKERVVMSEEKYLELYDFAPSGYLTLSRNGSILKLNLAASSMLGKDRTYLTNKRFGYVVSDEANPTFNHFLETIFNSKTRQTCELTLLPFEKHSIFVLLTGIVAENVEECLVIMVDVTARKQAEEEHYKLSQAVEQSPASILICDLNGNIEYANRKTFEVTRYSQQELIGKNPRVLSSGELPKEEYKTLWETISAGKEWRGEFHNMKKNGELYWESASISQIIDRTGKATHYLAVKEEITEKKKMIADLTLAKEKAEVSNNLKNAFIANISHEIRTPLNGILGMSNVIQDTFSEYATEKTERFFMALEKSSKRLMNSIDQMVSFSLLQVGAYPSSKENFSISACLQNTCDEYYSRAAAKGLKILFSSKIEDDTIFADQVALCKAIGNFIDNAVKFTSKGYVGITLYQSKQEKLCIDVYDTGIGISEDFLSHLFQPYSQEVIGYNRPFEGLGLGLPIAKKLLDLNGASISAKSTIKEGSVFTICFENQDTIEQQDSTPIDEIIVATAHKAPAGQKLSILLVEDDYTAQLYIETILLQRHFLETAKNAATALEMFLEKSYDLILVDISLPGGMTGLELTQVIRKGVKKPDIPIIAVTGHAFNIDRRNALAAGCNEYIAKPFKDFQLLDKICQFISI